jgi:Peptidase S24-like
MRLNDCTELAEVIQQLKIPEQIWLNKIAWSFHNPLHVVERLSRASFEEIQQVIDELLQDSNRRDVRFEVRQPYISIALSYAFCRIDESEKLQEYAEMAKWQFGRSGNQWNQAISHWFLGIVYRDNNFLQDAKAELEHAQDILNRLAYGAKQRLDYQTLGQCESQIDRLVVVLLDISGRITNAALSGESGRLYEILTWVVGLLKTLDNEVDSAWQNATYSLQPFDSAKIAEQIDYSGNILHNSETDPLLKPLANIFLAHCYANAFFGGDQESIHHALKHAEEAMLGFISLGEDYNQALSHLYLGFLYHLASEEEKSAPQLQKSVHLLGKLLESSNKDIEADGIIELQKEIKELIAQLNPIRGLDQNEIMTRPVANRDSRENYRKPSPLKPQKITEPTSTPMTRHGFEVRAPRLRSSAPNDRKPISRTDDQALEKAKQRISGTQYHITIPVDTRALVDPKSTSISLDANLYDRLKEYNQNNADRNQINQYAPNNYAQTGSKPKLVIPPYPFYGRATAGANGEVNFDEVECADGVTEDHILSVHGLKHRIYSTKEKDKKITIVEGKEYGWLGVDGESMNMAGPTPIDDQDYVLFYKTDNLEACDGKIVIASQSGIDEQPPRIMVKRLKSKRTSTGSKRFYLHSESSLEIHRIVIEITEANQLVGEVTAIAKPIR